MKKLLPVLQNELERRTFLAVPAVATGLAACGPMMMPGPDGSGPDGSSMGGPEGGSGDSSMSGPEAGGTDAAMGGPEGGMMGGPEGGMMGGPEGGMSCNPAGRMVGPPSMFQMNMPVLIRMPSPPIHVVRDAMGLFAVSAVCTHSGCTVAAGDPGFACPCHGSTFNLDGSNVGGPARSPLVHYAMCLSGGNVFVDTNTEVPAAQRLTT